MLKVTFKQREDINHNVSTFWFDPGREIKYTAGQYTEIYLPHKNSDERGEKHWFTLSSSPTDKLLSITTKNARERGSTFKKTLWALKPGDKVSLHEPMGDFVLPKDVSIPLVFVAGGIGVTPFHSMICWLLETHENRDIQFIYAVNEEKDAVFKELFEKYGVKPKLVVSNEGERLTPEKIIELAGGYTDKRIYISGPEPMVEDLTRGLEELGVPKNELISDYFPGYPPI